jgi:hypothetical protein
MERIMSDPNASATQAPVASGDGKLDPNPPKVDVKPDDKDPDSVPYTKYRELLDEKKKTQTKLKEFLDKENADREARLKEEGKFTEILAEERKQKEELAQRVQSFENLQKNGRKLNAFLKAAGTDLDEKWVPLVDLEKIQFKEGTEEVDKLSVNSALDNFKKTWPEAFKTKGPNMPPPSAPNGSGFISYSDWLKLPAKEMKKYNITQIRRE